MKRPPKSVVTLPLAPLTALLDLHLVCSGSHVGQVLSYVSSDVRYAGEWSLAHLSSSSLGVGSSPEMPPLPLTAHEAAALEAALSGDGAYLRYVLMENGVPQVVCRSHATARMVQENVKEHGGPNARVSILALPYDDTPGPFEEITA